MRGQILLDQRELIKQLPEYVYEVSPSFVDNPNLRQFSTISAANDHAIANMPPWPVKVSILVYPGNYIESIENAHYRIHIMGMADTTYYLKGVTLYNTGVGAVNYPIKYTGASPLNLLNMTIEVEPGGVYGNFTSMRCVNCAFLEGYFNEYIGSGSRTMEFKECYFSGDAFKLSGATDRRFLALRSCELDGGTIDLNSTNNVGANKFVKFERGISTCVANIGGDWSINNFRSEMYGGGRFVFDTTGDIVFSGALLPDGVHFLSNTAGCKSFVVCSFLNSSIASTHRDISAAVTVTNVEFSGNTQQNGIDGLVQIQSTTKNVGGSSLDMYYSLADAMKSITTDESIVLHSNVAGLAKLVMPTTGSVLIDGGGLYGISFIGDIVDLGLNDKLVLENLKSIGGGTIKINGNNSELHFHSCSCGTNMVQILATSGTGAKVHIKNSNLIAPTGCSVLQINSVDPVYRVTFSRLIGASGQPAVEYTVDADGKLISKVSTFIHGDGGTNYPLTYTGAGKVDFSIYSSGFNASWNASSFTNLIGSANNTFDTGITF